MSARDHELRISAAKEIEKYQDTIESDLYRLSFHHMPSVGVMSNPTGLIQWKGVYHLFYQWVPFTSENGPRYWGHYTSTDFINWKHEKIALTPSDWFDKDGIYSGNALIHDEKLYLFYTGKVEDQFYLCMAISDDGINFEKKGVVVNRPDDYAGHFRDPKVFKKDNGWYMVVGAQSSDQQGKATLLHSDNLTDWKLLGNIAGSNEYQLGEFGYMWESPDVVELNGQDLLFVSPQGLEEEGMEFVNNYQSGYFAGKLDVSEPRLSHRGFRELDRGFDFYAPQITSDDNDRRILIAQMSVPDQDEQAHPTVENQWLHCLTIPRELTWNGQQIIQQPVVELNEMRGPVLLHSSITIENDQKAVRGIGGKCLELNIDFEKMDQQFAIELFQYAAISFTKKDNILTLSRPSLKDKSRTEFRRVKLSNSLRNLRLFIDHSSLELFVNDGEEVFTSRIFPNPEEDHLLFTSLGETTFSLEQWKLNGLEYE